MTEPITICGIAGSLRAGSYNRALLRTARKKAPESVEIRIFDRVGEIPTGIGRVPSRHLP